MPISRTQVIQGPALVTRGGVTYYTDGGIRLDFEAAPFAVTADGYGQVDSRDGDAIVRVSFRPIGRWAYASTSSGLFYPCARKIGASVFGTGSDTATVIQPFDSGQPKITIHNTGVIRMPTLQLSATSQIFASDVEIVGIRKTGIAWGTADSLFTLASNSTPTLDFDPADIATGTWTGAWGALSSPWDAIETESGWTIELDMAVDPVVTDASGTIDFRIANLTARATAALVGITEADITAKLLLQGSGGYRGRSHAAAGADLRIYDTGTVIGDITINVANLISARHVYADAQMRVAECVFEATRTVTSGALDPLIEWTEQ